MHTLAWSWNEHFDKAGYAVQIRYLGTFCFKFVSCHNPKQGSLVRKIKGRYIFLVTTSIH